MKEFCIVPSKHLRLIVLIFVIIFFKVGYSQNLYIARGYWQETNKEKYRSLLDKKEKGLDLTQDESNYLSDYEVYLKNYYSRLSYQEKALYKQMNQSWDRELAIPKTICSPHQKTRKQYQPRIYKSWFARSWNISINRY
jgi:hypothetical protein